MKKTKKISLITPLLITLFTACSSPSIEQPNKETIEIVLDKEHTIHAHGVLLEEKRVNLNNINIYQYVYQTKSNSNIIIYEDAIVSTGYRFDNGVSKNLTIIFPDYQREIVSSSGNFYFIKLSKKKEELYLILENINNKRYKLVYGFDKKLFTSLQSIIIHNKDIELHRDSNQSNNVMRDPQHVIRSSWSYKNIITDGLLRKVGHRKPR